MVRASYFRRRAKSPLFSRSVGGKCYVGELASWMGHWGGQAAFLEWEWVTGDGMGLWREREGEHAPVFSSPFWGFRAGMEIGRARRWNQKPGEGIAAERPQTEIWRPGQSWCCLCCPWILTYLSSEDSSSTCLVVCPQG